MRGLGGRWKGRRGLCDGREGGGALCDVGVVGVESKFSWNLTLMRWRIRQRSDKNLKGKMRKADRIHQTFKFFHAPPLLFSSSGTSGLVDCTLSFFGHNNTQLSRCSQYPSMHKIMTVSWWPAFESSQIIKCGSKHYRQVTADWLSRVWQWKTELVQLIYGLSPLFGY